ncbi:MAG: hypothetical protein ACREU1_12215, partial [Burkholderiales bacterium]
MQIGSRAGVAVAILLLLLTATLPARAAWSPPAPGTPYYPSQPVPTLQETCQGYANYYNSYVLRIEDHADDLGKTCIIPW